MSKTLFCSAWDDETSSLETDSVSLGIGFLEAAINLEALLAKEKYEQIVFLGTCGAYSEEEPLGEIFAVESVQVLTAEAFGHDAYSLPPIKEEIQAADFFKTEIKKVKCISSLDISSSTERSKNILSYYGQSFLLENMELYGVATVAKKHQIPWQAFLALTNYTNAYAHADWKKNHLTASQKMCEFINRDFYKS